MPDPAPEITVRVTYTRGKDKGVTLHLPAYPCDGDEWRTGIEA